MPPRSSSHSSDAAIARKASYTHCQERWTCRSATCTDLTMQLSRSMWRATGLYNEGFIMVVCVHILKQAWCSKVVPHLMDHAPTPPWSLQLHATKPYENADKCKSVDGRARVCRGTDRIMLSTAACELAATGCYESDGERILIPSRPVSPCVCVNTGIIGSLVRLGPVARINSVNTPFFSVSM